MPENMFILHSHLIVTWPEHRPRLSVEKYHGPCETSTGSDIRWCGPLEGPVGPGSSGLGGGRASLSSSFLPRVTPDPNPISPKSLCSLWKCRFPSPWLILFYFNFLFYFIFCISLLPSVHPTCHWHLDWYVCGSYKGAIVLAITAI